MPSKEYFREYYLKNRERILKRMNAYNQMHSEERKVYDRLRHILTYTSKPKENFKIEKNVQVKFN
jgi:hypothetical protein